MTPEIQLKATGKGEEWCHQMQAVFESLHLSKAKLHTRFSFVLLLHRNILSLAAVIIVFTSSYYQVVAI